MMHFWMMSTLVCTLASLALAQPTTAPSSAPGKLTIDFQTPLDPALQQQLVHIDETIRKSLDMPPEATSVGWFDLNTNRLAGIHLDHEEYGASIPKVGILLAYFETHPEAAEHLDPTVRHELGMMAKASNNEMASKYSHELGLLPIQNILNSYGFYDEHHGGGIWVGKHYGKDTERHGDPVGDNSHAATPRQLLRYFLMLEQGQLVSPAASKTMREIFESPDIPADDIKFVKGLKGRDVQIIRKWGSWENWLHDSAVITGGGRHYILVALTNHSQGDTYLEALAPAVDDVMTAKP